MYMFNLPYTMRELLRGYVDHWMAIQEMISLTNLARLSLEISFLSHGGKIIFMKTLLIGEYFYISLES